MHPMRSRNSIDWHHNKWWYSERSWRHNIQLESIREQKEKEDKIPCLPIQIFEEYNNLGGVEEKRTILSPDKLDRERWQFDWVN